MILNAEGSFLAVRPPPKSIFPLPFLCTKLTQSPVIKQVKVIFLSDGRQAKMLLDRIHAVSLKINVEES